MGKKPQYAEIDGMLVPKSFVPEVLRDAFAFKPGPGDILVTTYPKCGTTWALQIAALILRRGEPFLTAEDYFSHIPFLEMTTIEQLSKVERPRCIKNHMPLDRLIFSKEAKYIYVARHPADCVVSFFHHTRFFPAYFFTDGKFEDYFELFIRGQVDWNDYFDHLLPWYERRNEPNVLFLTYESMKSDHRGICLKIARFLGETYFKSLNENDEAILKKVLEYSSFEYMKSTVNKFWKEELANLPSELDRKQSPVTRRYAEVMEEALKDSHLPNGEFIRKGVVGEGNITLSEEQMNKLNARIREKTSHSDVMKLWETD